MAGDRFVLMEYGDLVFDLDLNRVARLAADALRASDLAELITDLAPGSRSLLVGFDPNRIDPVALATRLVAAHAELPFDEPVPPGREVQLPLAFNDSSTTEAVSRHAATLARPDPDAPSDIDDIAAASGLDSQRDVLAAVMSERWMVSFIGYFPGLPFLLPMDEQQLRVPKLSRRRVWTAEGAVTMGGACMAIFPVEAPGSYRVLGRTLPIYALDGVNDSFGDGENLLRAGDIVTFDLVSEAELIDLRRQAYENRYRYRVRDGAVDGPVGASR